MYTLENMDNKVLQHLYDLGILGIHGGWERESNLDVKVVDELYNFKLIEKSFPQGFVRLSEHGVGAVLFGFQNADKIYALL